MGDGVVSVYAEGHEHVGGAVRDEALDEADGLAGEDASFPAHRDLPDDVRGHGQKAHRQVCTATALAWFCKVVVNGCKAAEKFP